VDLGLDMSIEGLRKYLEFEVYKVMKGWPKRRTTSRMRWMLAVAYIETCYNMIEELVPKELHPVVATLRKHPIDASIYDKIKATYVSMWKAAKAGQRNVNLLKETYELNELVRNQRNPLL